MPSPSYHIITLTVPQEWADIIQGQLYDLGCCGLEENDSNSHQVQIKAYFDDQGPLNDLITQIQQKIPHTQKITGTSISLTSIQQKIYTFEPIELVPNTWIVPPDDMPYKSTKPSGQKIIIRPGMAFGTGRHESTQLVVKALSELTELPSSLLDVGTGSGILAIYAKKRGIHRIDVVEIDELAIENAQDNFMLNHIQGIQIFRDIKMVPSSYDLLLANILAPTIIHLKNQLLAQVKPQGRLIFSGITQDESPQIEQAFSELTLVKKYQNHEWVCFCYQKMGDGLN